MDPDSYTKLVLLLIFLFLSSFFSAAETAFMTLNKIHLRNMLDNNIKNAERVKKIFDSPQKLLSTILISNNLVNIGASSIATSLAIKLSGNNAGVLFLSTGIITFFILVFSEITPKHFASQHSEDIALKVAKPILILAYLMTPIVFILNIITNGIIFLLGANPKDKHPVITESELKTIVNVSHEEGVFEVDEREMINNVFEFKSSAAKDVMIPRTDVIAINLETKYDDIIEIFKTEGLSRIPVYRKTIDNIIGILYLKDFMFNADKNNFDLKKYIRQPFFTYEYKPTRELFGIMRVKRIPMAIILDEYGGTSGIITIEDLVEEIVGDIADEYDENELQIEKIKEDEYIVDGSTKIDDVNQELNINLKSDDFDSIGGYLIGVIGYFPKAKEIIETDGLKFIIEQVDKNRIERVKIINLDGQIKNNDQEESKNNNINNKGGKKND